MTLHFPDSSRMERRRRLSIYNTQRSGGKIARSIPIVFRSVSRHHQQPEGKRERERCLRQLVFVDERSFVASLRQDYRSIIYSTLRVTPIFFSLSPTCMTLWSMPVRSVLLLNRLLVDGLIYLSIYFLSFSLSLALRPSDGSDGRMVTKALLRARQSSTSRDVVFDCLCRWCSWNCVDGVSFPLVYNTKSRRRQTQELRLFRQKKKKSASATLGFFAVKRSLANMVLSLLTCHAV